MEQVVINEEFLKKHFEEEGKTAEEVSKEFHIPIFILMMRANKFGIKVKRDIAKGNPFLRRMQEKKDEK